MHLPKRDIIATGLVAAAGLLYALWAIGSTLPGLSSIRATGIIILALGMVASASAVVPGFAQLIHGNKLYLAATSLIGVVAFVGGLQMLVAASETGLGVMLVAMVVLWLIRALRSMA